MKKEAKAPAAPDQSKFTNVTLETPIMRGETEIKDITVQKPTAGQMRGLSLQDLIQSDVAAIITLAPRLTNPPLMEADLEAMDVTDFTELAGAISGFFMNKAMKEHIAKMSGQQ